MYNLQLLCKSLSDGNRYIRIVHRNELPDTVRKEGWLVGGHGRKRADECVKCGKCEEVCPQHIKIREELEKVAKELLA